MQYGVSTASDCVLLLQNREIRAIASNHVHVDNNILLLWKAWPGKVVGGKLLLPPILCIEIPWKETRRNNNLEAISFYSRNLAG